MLLFLFIIIQIKFAHKTTYEHNNIYYKQIKKYTFVYILHIYMHSDVYIPS